MVKRLFCMVLMALALVGCGGGGGGPTLSAELTPSSNLVPVRSQPYAVKATSYENAKNMGLAPMNLPAGFYSGGWARADFRQDGTMMLFTTEPMNTSTNQSAPSRFEFHNINADGSTTKINGMIDSEDGCVVARKAVVADFNNDQIPDVAVACHGYDAAPFTGESNWVVLSNKATGKFTSRKLSDAIGFFHGGAAADVTGDGNVDFLSIDQREGVRVWQNDGKGNFAERTDLQMPMLSYYSLEVVDLDRDGKYDYLLGGHEHENAPTTFILANGRQGFIPSVQGEGIVLDFTVVPAANGDTDVYIARTSDGTFAKTYTSQVVQRVRMSTLSASVIHNAQNAKQILVWMLPTNGYLEHADANHPVKVKLQ